MKNAMPYNKRPNQSYIFVNLKCSLKVAKQSKMFGLHHTSCDKVRQIKNLVCDIPNSWGRCLSIKYFSKHNNTTQPNMI